MTKLVRFKVKGGLKNHLYECVVKESFFKKYKSLTPSNIIKNVDIYSLITEYRLLKYLHNPKGYAMKNLNNKCKTYWFNGLPLLFAAKMKLPGVTTKVWKTALKKELTRCD